MVGIKSLENVKISPYPVKDKGDPIYVVELWLEHLKLCKVFVRMECSF